MVLQQVHHIVVVKDQMGSVQLDTLVKVQVQAEVKLEELVMVLELGRLQAVDDGIYKLHQTCTVQFSRNRNTLSDPVIMHENSSLNKTSIIVRKRVTPKFTKHT